VGYVVSVLYIVEYTLQIKKYILYV